ncbi:MAG: hypothetical protein MZW92_40470 [Comamonadaceae bacterium]|nr:hypothetical protein [Comamonadaceae bacterium]
MSAPERRPGATAVKHDDGFPPATIVHFTFPARGKKHAGREAALVRRRPAAGAPGGARAAVAACPRAGRSSSARRARSCARPTRRARA